MRGMTPRTCGKQELQHERAFRCVGEVSASVSGRRRGDATGGDTDPGYMSREILKFRTDKFNT